MIETKDVVHRRAKKRIRGLGLLVVGVLGTLGVRGAALCVVPEPQTISEASIQRWGQVTLKGKRGEILDRHGRRLATSVPTPNIVVDPMRVADEDIHEVATQVANIVNGNFHVIAEKMGRNSRYARLAHRVHPRVAAEIESLNQGGLYIERNPSRYYPEENLAAQTLGFVDASGVGKSGLEAEYDDYLSGGSVIYQRRRDRRGRSVDRSSSHVGTGHMGMNIHTTLDRSIQRMAERALNGIMERSKPKSASIIAVEVTTGDILALANAPVFNPNAIESDPAPRRNHVVQDAIEPGSIFKPFTIAAAIEEGIVDASTMIDCESGVWSVGRTRIHDDHPHSLISVSEVMKFSSNIGTSKLAFQLGGGKFTEYVRDFGFGEITGISLPGERRGVLRNPEKIRPIELATNSFGQGLSVTSIQVAMALGAIANGGLLMEPRLVRQVEDAYGVPEYIQHPRVKRRVISRETADKVRDMMVTVTETGGTGTAAIIPGYDVAGKTGTAQKVTEGKYGSERIASFVGFVPADDPVLAIVVVADEPSEGSSYGGVVAGPAFAEFGREALRYLGVAARKPPPTEDAPIPVTGESEKRVALAWVGDAYKIPDLTGSTMRDALVALEGAGLAVKLSGTGVAVHQSPDPGAPLRPGDSVEIVFQ